jgi:hypothetical protein
MVAAAAKEEGIPQGFRLDAAVNLCLSWIVYHLVPFCVDTSALRNKVVVAVNKKTIYIYIYIYIKRPP